MSIEFNGSLKNKQLEKKVIDTIVSEVIGNFQNYHSLKLDIELINEICNLIEEAVKSNKIKKINKLDLFIKAHTAVFGNITEQEKAVLISNIEYLHNNGKIKALSISKKIINFLKELITKKK